MKPVILIPARLESTRLLQKPLALIAGEAMIVQVWRRGMAAKAGPVLVACDDVRIKEAVEKAGGAAVMTRVDHASGSDRIYEALMAVDPENTYDVVVNLQGDVPTIEPDIIRAVLKPLENPRVDIATLACLIKEPGERTDPSVVKPVFVNAPKASAGEIIEARTFTRNPATTDGPLYHHIGIYAYRREALTRFVGLPPSPLERKEKLEQLRAIEAGMRIDVAIVDTVPLGVDTQEHLDRARKILEV